MPNDKNKFTVAAHGKYDFNDKKYKIVDERFESNKRLLDAKEFANIIKTYPGFKEANFIELKSCNLGHPENDGNIFAQNLANITGKIVIGYTGEYIFSVFPLLNKPAENSKGKFFYPQIRIFHEK